MNHLRTHPAGIDIPIWAYQSFFYGQMLKKLGITDDTAFDLYGRAHNNTRTSGSVAEVERANGEYMDVLFNDALKVGQGFFVVADRTDYAKGDGTTKVGLILQYTMTGITAGPYNPMHDEQVNATIMDICRQPRYGFTLTGLVRRIDNVFREYPGWKDTVKFSDMYPWHCLRLEFNLLHQINPQFNC